MANRNRANRRLDQLLNLGPASASRLLEAGIADEAALRHLGAVAAYRRVKHAFPRETTLVLLYALAGALTDTPWTALPPEIRDKLRRRAAAQPASSCRAEV